MLTFTATRTALQAALAPLLPLGRVHLYPPEIIVPPCIWIDQPSGSYDGEAAVEADYPIHIVGDGNPDEQCRISDNLLSAAWNVVMPIGQPLDWSADFVTTQGTEEAHRYRLTVRCLIGVQSFCSPVPVQVPIWPEPVPTP